MLSGRKYNRQLSLFNPYSVLFLSLQLFFKWHNLLTYAGYGYCRFRFTLGISLTMPNKKYFFDFLLLKIFTGHNITNLSEKSWPQVHYGVQIESFSTIYSMPDTRHCFDCGARPLRCVFEHYYCLLFQDHMRLTMPVLAKPPLGYRLHTHDISLIFSNVMARKNL